MKISFLILMSFVSLTTHAKRDFVVEFRDAETNTRLDQEVKLIGNNPQESKSISDGIFSTINFKKGQALVINSENYLSDTLVLKRNRKKDTLIFYLFPTEDFMQKRWGTEKESLIHELNKDTVFLADLYEFQVYLSRSLTVSKVAIRDSQNRDEQVFLRYKIAPSGVVSTFEIVGANHKSLERAFLRSILQMPLFIFTDYDEMKVVTQTIPIKVKFF